MWRYVDPRQFSPGQSDDDQNIKQLKAEGRNHEQVHGRDVWRMVAQKGSPALTGWLTSCGHVFGNGRLRHRKAELEQLTMNTRRTPKAGSQRSSAGSAPANLQRSAADRLWSAISSANSGENQHDASARGSLAG